MLCSSSITLGLCTTIGLCTQTNKHRSSCVTENSCDFVEFDKWYLDWALGVLGNIFWVEAQLKCTFSGSRLFVCPSVCRSVHLSASRLHFQLFKHDALNASTFGSMISTNCFCHLCWLLCNDQCIKVYAKSQNVFRDDCKKKKQKQ